MSIISLPYTLTDGTVAVAAQVMSDLNTIINDYNGNINNSNLSSSIAITDSKLNQITTAGKVSGTALTGLASIPSGAGVIPLANLPANIFSPVVLSVSNSATQSLTTQTWAQRTFNTVNEDSGGYWASNTYTPLVAGWYFVSYSDSINTNAQGQAGVSVYKNGAIFQQSINWAAIPFIGDLVGATVTTIVQMNGSTDTLQFFIYAAGDASTGGGAGYSNASIFRVI